MADKTKIEWATATWSPVTGCTPVSTACDHCYAARMVKRFPHLHHGPVVCAPPDFSKIIFHPSRLDQPLRWKKPRRIFVCSMGDLFHKDVEHGWIVSVFSHIEAAPRHTFMILTKRPDRMLDHFQGGLSRKFPVLPNLWLGVTAENQEMADQRIPILLQTPAAKRFVSIEPCLGPVEFERGQTHDLGPASQRRGMNQGLDWVICGGESGPGARPMHPDWPRSLRDQCQEAGVPFFFKQWGEWVSVSEVEGPGIHRHFLDGATVRRTGKKLAGCLLDGREWKEFPDATR